VQRRCAGGGEGEAVQEVYISNGHTATPVDEILATLAGCDAAEQADVY